MDREHLDQIMPDVAVGSYVATGLLVAAAGFAPGLISFSPIVVLALFHYAPPVLALTAGAATAVTPQPRMPHRLFWGTVALFAIGPALWLTGIDVTHAAGLTIRLGYGAGMLLGGGLWLRQRRAIRQGDSAAV